MSSSWTFRPGLSGMYIAMKGRLRKWILLHAVFCLALCSAACGEGSSRSGPSPPSGGSSATATTQTPIAPLIGPPNSDERPLEPGSLGRTIGPDGLPTLQPPKGVNVNVDTLFAEDIKDPLERSKRVETAVIEMRRDLDAAMPAIKRLVAIEQDIQLLTSQLQTLLNNEPVAADPQPLTSDSIASNDSVLPAAPVAPQEFLNDATVPDQAASPPISLNNIETEQEPLENLSPPTPIATPPPPIPPPIAVAQLPPAPQTISGLQAVGLRLGDYDDKTRIVIDLTGPVTYRHDLDNDEKILVVELEKAMWTGLLNQTLASSLVQSYSTQPMDGGGSRIIIVLTRATEVVEESLLTPEGGSGYRLMLDLKK